MKRTKALLAITKIDRQPIQQIGMRRLLTHAAKIVRCRHQTVPKVMQPDPINDRPPRQWVLTVDNPLCQGGAAMSFGVIRRQRPLPAIIRSQRYRARLNNLFRLADVPSVEDSHFARSAASGFEVALRREL